MVAFSVDYFFIFEHKLAVFILIDRLLVYGLGSLLSALYLIFMYFSVGSISYKYTVRLSPYIIKALKVLTVRG